MENDRMQSMDNSVGSSVPVKRAYAPRERLMLIYALAAGIVFAWVSLGKHAFSTNDFSSFALCYSAFWLTYMAGFYLACWEKAKSKPVGYALALAALFLMLRPLIYKETHLSFLNFLAIPALLMLHAVECCFDAPEGRQEGYILAYIRGVFVYPFRAIGRVFGAAASVFRKDGVSDKGRAVRIGLASALPVAVIVIALLVNSDAAISYYFDRAFAALEIDVTLLRILGALIAAMMVYSFLHSMAYGTDALPSAERKRPFAAAGVTAAVSVLVAIYAVFVAVQFTYLTGLGGLPAELTYSEYAVRGFNELMTVAAINLGVYALCVTYTESTRTVRALLAALLAMTLLLLASAMARLVMYIDAYGLTFRRILPFWFMLFLAALIVLSLVKLYRDKLKLLRIAAFTFVAFYLALNFVNLDAMVAKSVISRAEAAGCIDWDDAHFLRDQLSSDADAVINASPFAKEIEELE